MFPTNQIFLVAFQGQTSMTMVSQPSQRNFVYECLDPYRDMVNDPVYPKRLRNKLKNYIRFIENYSLLFRLSIQGEDESNSYSTFMAKKLEELEKIAQELDSSII